VQLVNNLDDFSKYYSDTWIARKVQKDVVPYKVNSINAITGKARLYRLGSLQREEFSFDIIADQFILAAPPLGMINTAKSVTYLELVPARQWAKGFTLTRCMAHQYGPEPRVYTELELVPYVFSPEYLSYSDAVAAVNKADRGACAFSPIFCVEAIANNVLPVIRYKTFIIGQADEDSVLLAPGYERYTVLLEKWMPKRTKVKIWKQDS